jgi:hypothetical protein
MDLGAALGYWKIPGANEQLLSIPFNPGVLMKSITREELVECTPQRAVVRLQIYRQNYRYLDFDSSLFSNRYCKSLKTHMLSIHFSLIPHLVQRLLFLKRRFSRPDSG